MAVIILGVSGSIAAFKAADLCSKLTQAGHEVHVIMTAAAAQLVAPNTFLNLSRNKVATDLFDAQQSGQIDHIALTDKAELAVIAPATANTIAQLALGLAPDMLSTTMLALACPLLLCPAMNPRMWRHPAVLHNLALLRGRGVQVLSPGEGTLACGHEGPGRLAEPGQILAAITAVLRDGRLPTLMRRFGVLLTPRPGQEPNNDLTVEEGRAREALRLTGLIEGSGDWDGRPELGGFLIIRAADAAAAAHTAAQLPLVREARLRVELRALDKAQPS